MDLGDFFTDITALGGERRGWRSALVVVFILLGAGGGAWLGYGVHGFPIALGWGAVGAFVGWFLGMFIRGLIMIGLITFIALVGLWGWMWLTGQL